MKLPPIDIGNIDFKLTIGGLVLNVMYVKFGYFYSSMPEHSHSLGSYELHYIPSGQGVLIAQGNRYQIKPGTLFITGPDVTHEQITNPNDPMAEYCIFFEILANESSSIKKLSILREDKLSELLVSTPFWFGSDNSGLMELFEMLANELAHYRLGLHHIATNILEMILIRTIRQYSDNHASMSIPLKSLDDKRIVIIESSFLFQYSTITLSQLAEMLGLSTRQTERAVRKQYGMSFTEKKKQVRMSAATHFLLTTELSVTAIARQIGFATVEQFSNAFKKFYGINATKYRKKRKNQGEPLSNREDDLPKGSRTGAN